jgi:stalled ribosome rescue protein Dom34
MKHYHAAVWVDHAEARIYTLNASDAEEWTIKPHDQRGHLHHKAGTMGPGKAVGDKHYFESVAAAVKDAGEILIAGPGTAKSELAAYLKEHHKDIAAKVVAVEPLDHPNDGELVKFARKFFRGADRMRPAGTAPKTSA